MTVAEIVTLMQSAGVAVAVLAILLAWITKSLIPQVLEQHDRDREAFQEAIVAMKASFDRMAQAVESRPCWWQRPEGEKH